MHSAKSDVDRHQISLSVVGVICGLMGGGLCSLLVMAAIKLIYTGVELVLPGPHGARGLLVFYICLYSVWLLVTWYFARRVELIFWALAMFPLPSLLIAVWLMER